MKLHEPFATCDSLIFSQSVSPRLETKEICDNFTPKKQLQTAVLTKNFSETGKRTHVIMTWFGRESCAAVPKSGRPQRLYFCCVRERLQGEGKTSTIAVCVKT